MRPCTKMDHNCNNNNNSSIKPSQLSPDGTMLGISLTVSITRNNNSSNNNINMEQQCQEKEEYVEEKRNEENDEQDDVTTSMTSDEGSILTRRETLRNQQQLMKSLTKFHQDRRKSWQQFLKQQSSHRKLPSTNSSAAAATAATLIPPEHLMIGLPTAMRAAIANRGTTRHVLMDLVAATVASDVSEASQNEDVERDSSSSSSSTPTNAADNTSNKNHNNKQNKDRHHHPHRRRKNPLRRSLSSRRRLLQESALRDFKKATQKRNLGFLKEVAQQAKRLNEARKAIREIAKRHVIPTAAATLGKARYERGLQRQERARHAAQLGQERQRQVQARQQRAHDAAQAAQERQAHVTQVQERARDAAQRGQQRQKQVRARQTRARDAARMGQERQAAALIRRQRALDAARSGQERLVTVQRKSVGAHEAARLAQQRLEMAYVRRQRARDAAMPALQKRATIALQARIRGYLCRKQWTVVQDFGHSPHEFVVDLLPDLLGGGTITTSKIPQWTSWSSSSLVNKCVIARRVSDLTMDDMSLSMTLSFISTDDEDDAFDDKMDEENDEVDTFPSMEPPRRILSGCGVRRTSDLTMSAFGDSFQSSLGAFGDSLRSFSGVGGEAFAVSSKQHNGVDSPPPPAENGSPIQKQELLLETIKADGVPTTTPTMTLEARGNASYTSYYSDIKDTPRKVFKPRGDFIHEGRLGSSSSSSGSSYISYSSTMSSVTSDTETSDPPPAGQEQQQHHAPPPPPPPPHVSGSDASSTANNEYGGASGNSTSCSFLSSNHGQISSTDVSISSDDLSLDWIEEEDVRASEITPASGYRSDSNLLTSRPGSMSIPPAFRRMETSPRLPVRKAHYAKMGSTSQLSQSLSALNYSEFFPMSPRPPQRQRSFGKMKKVEKINGATDAHLSPKKPVRKHAIGVLPDAPFLEGYGSVSESLCERPPANKEEMPNDTIQGSIRLLDDMSSPKLPIRHRTPSEASGENAPDAITAPLLVEERRTISVYRKELDSSISRFSTSRSQLLLQESSSSIVDPASPVLPKMPVRQRTSGVAEPLSADARSNSRPQSLSTLDPASPVLPKMPVRQRTSGVAEPLSADAHVNSRPQSLSTLDMASPVLPKMPMRQRTSGLPEALPADAPATEYLSHSSLPLHLEVFHGSMSRFDMNGSGFEHSTGSLPVELRSPCSPQIPIRQRSAGTPETPMADTVPGVPLLESSSYSAMPVCEEEETFEAEVHNPTSRFDSRDINYCSLSPTIPVRRDDLNIATEHAANCFLGVSSNSTAEGAKQIKEGDFQSVAAAWLTTPSSEDGAEKQVSVTRPDPPPFASSQTSIKEDSVSNKRVSPVENTRATRVRDGSPTASTMARHSSYSTRYGFNEVPKVQPIGVASRHSTGGAKPSPKSNVVPSRPHNSCYQLPFMGSPRPLPANDDSRFCAEGINKMTLASSFFESPTSVRDLVWSRVEEAKQRRFESLVEDAKKEANQ